MSDYFTWNLIDDPALATGSTAATAEPTKPATAEPATVSTEPTKPAGSAADSWRGLNRDERIKKARQLLEEGVKSFFDSDQYKLYLQSVSRLHRYSFGNILLATIQLGGHVSHLASFRQWKKLGRTVKRGQHAAYIWFPMQWMASFIAPEGVSTDDLEERGYVMTDEKTADGRQIIKHKRSGWGLGPVFDYAQTEGPEGTEIELVKQLKGDAAEYRAHRRILEAVAPCAIVTKTDEDWDGESSYGYYCPPKVSDTGSDFIAVRPGLSDLHAIKTLIHETAHALYDWKEVADGGRYREVRAESIAYTVLYALGIDTSEYSFGYVASWSEDSKKLTELKQLGADIQQGVHAILTALETGKKLERLNSKLEAAAV